MEDGENATLLSAQYSAEKVSARFKLANEALQPLKRYIENKQNEGTLDGKDIITLIEGNIENNNGVIGIGTLLEPGILAIETSTASKSLFDKTGRFIPYFSKDGDNIIGARLKGFENADGIWYQKPKSEVKSMLTEPFIYNINGKDYLLTTISVPLVDQSGKFFGVLKADITIDFLHEVVDTIAPKGGYAGIITGSGMLTTNSINEEINGTYMQDAIDWTSIDKTLKSGSPDSTYVDSKQLGEQAFNAFAPIQIQGIDETWSVQLVLPKSIILSTFNEINKITVIFALAIILIMSIATAVFIHKQLRPLRFLKASMETAATGDLTKKINKKYIKNDEIGAVTIAYNNMLDQTNMAIQTVLDSSTQLNHSSNHVQGAFNEILTASEDVSKATAEIAGGATKQAEDTEHTSTVMIDLSEQIDALTSLTAQMTDLSNQSKLSTEKGMTEVASLRERNNATNEMNAKIQQQIEALASNISNINQVITSIQGVTEQTNLLALNASIEAARAGKHGKGFAVVANEVRKLAEQSKCETEIIKNTVDSILKDSQQTVSVLASNVTLIQAQNESVHSTESAFKDNYELSSSIADAIEGLASELSTMLYRKNQTMSAIESISAISEETAASIEEVSASADNQQIEIERVAEAIRNMTTISQKLNEVVQQFKLSK